MSNDRTQALIESLAAAAAPVRPLASPLRRGLVLLALIALIAAPSVARFGDIAGLSARYLGREELMLVEMGAMLATGMLAILGAFSLSIPGRPRLWLLAPLPFFVAWIGLSGFGCYADVVRLGVSGGTLYHSANCFFFICAIGILIGLPLLWVLSRAKPIDPLPVALLGGLGAAALSACLLQFFHPFAVTFLDLAVHLVALAIVVGLIALFRRPLLRSA